VIEDTHATPQYKVSTAKRIGRSPSRRESQVQVACSRY
jgi:hypothetical protein